MSELMENIDMYLWAAMHHKRFKHCRIQQFLFIQNEWYEYSNTWSFKFNLHWCTSYIFYIPYEVRYAYREAKGLPTLDDMPF